MQQQPQESNRKKIGPQDRSPAAATKMLPLKSLDETCSISSVPIASGTGAAVEKTTLANKFWFIPPMAGLISGSIAAAITFPTEAMKKRKQSNQPPIGFEFFKPNTWAKSAVILYTGGLAFVASVGPTTLIQSTAMDFMTESGLTKEGNIMPAFICGALGGFCSTFVESLILAQQYKRNARKPSGPIKTIESVVRQHGVTKLWTGLGCIMARECVFGGLALRAADSIAKWAVNTTGNKNHYFLTQLLVGMAGALVTHPADTVATLMQHNLHQYQKESVAAIVKRVWMKHGLKGFYEGGCYRVGLFTGCMMIISYLRQPTEDFLMMGATASFGHIIPSASASSASSTASSSTTSVSDQ